MRLMKLANDNTPGSEKALHAIQMAPGYDFVVLLQGMSSLRMVGDIDEAIINCSEQDCEFCVSVAEDEHSPYWIYHMTVSLMKGAYQNPTLS